MKVAINTLNKLPLSFQPNQGQCAPEVRFLAKGSGYNIFLTSDEIVFSLKNQNKEAETNKDCRTAQHLRLKLTGANENPDVSGMHELVGKVNYFIGNDPEKWQTDIPTYAEVKYADVYPGIDMVCYGGNGQLEYDFVVQPGADPKMIVLDVDGGEMALDENGNLVIDDSGVTMHKPSVYQKKNGIKEEIDGHFRIASSRIGFELGAYDTGRPLVIDPVLTLEYSTYLGGKSYDEGYDIAVDSNGNAYVTGETASTDFPVQNAYQPDFAGRIDVFVTKLNTVGNALVYSTYLGGVNRDIGEGIAVDSAGCAYVTGFTESRDFPVKNAYQPVKEGLSNYSDAFITKLNAAGDALVYSTFLGGWAHDFGEGIAVDSAGCAYVTGSTYSADFPVKNAYQPTYAGNYDLFITKLTAAGDALVYSTYLGGVNLDVGEGIAVDSAGCAYVTGYTNSTDFPVQNAYQLALAGSYDAFVTKLNAAGDALVYSTYLGGVNQDIGKVIAVDSASCAYVTGSTYSKDFPVQDAYQTTLAGGADVFITKLNAAGTMLIYSTYLGGMDDDGGWSITVDAGGCAYVTGATASNNFPVQDAFQPALAGYFDVFVTKLNAAGNALVYSTYLGGSNNDAGCGIAVDAGGSAYVTGCTNSTDFPVQNAFQPAFAGEYDAFVFKLTQAPKPTQPTRGFDFKKDIGANIHLLL